MQGYNFTEGVRRCLANAREEAVRLHHEYVGTEHMLLGLLERAEGVGYEVLLALDVDVDEMLNLIEETVKRGRSSQQTGPDLPYTSRAKKVLELAMSEARELGHSYVGSEHLLLGLLLEEKGIAAQVLVHTGVSIERAREKVREILGDPAHGQISASTESRIPKREAPTLVTVELRYDGGWTHRREFRSTAEARAFLAQI